MSYNKKIWKNNESGGTPINATSLNDLETRIGLGFDNMPRNLFDSSNMKYISTGKDANDLKESGVYYTNVNNTNGSIANYPKTSYTSMMIVMKIDTVYIQMVIVSTSEIYIRRYRINNDTWENWYKFDAFDSSWQNLPLKEGISVGESTGKAQYRKIGKLVQLRGDIQGIGAANQTVATLPTGYRPSTRVFCVNACSGLRFCRFSILTNGNVLFEWTNDQNYNLSSYHINATFLID